MNSIAANAAVKRLPLCKSYSFGTFDANAGRNNPTGWNFFDVPAEGYSEGNITGARAAIQLAKACHDGEEMAGLENVLKEIFAIRATDEKERYSRYGATAGFMYVLEELFAMAFDHPRFKRIAKELLSGYEASMASDLEELKEKNAAILVSLFEEEE